MSANSYRVMVSSHGKPKQVEENVNRNGKKGAARRSSLSMDVDDCIGSSYISGAASGESSVERDFTGGPGGPTASTPNSRQTSPSRSLSANSIKVELYSDDEPGRGAEEDRGDPGEEGGLEHGADVGGAYRELSSVESMTTGATRLPNGKLKCDICGMICIGPNVLMVHKRSHTGERPFQCNQCGASFTQKGNLLRHIKLHSGEKPFKCPFCSYACRRRDALTGHLRTHSVSSPTVGKPYKCSYCGRSYKQQSTLEEHRERCHSYLQSLETLHPTSAQAPGEEMRELSFTPDSLLQPPSDKIAFIDGLTNSITKRKRSTPQKFVGQKHMRLTMADESYELSAALDKDGDMRPGEAEPPRFPGLGGDCGGGGGGVTEHPARPRCLPSSRPSRLSELGPVVGSAHRAAPPPRGPERTGGREAAEGHEDPADPAAGRAPSPSNGCQDSTDTESAHDEPPPAHHERRHLLRYGLHAEHGPPPPRHRARGRPSPGGGRDGREEGGHPGVRGRPSPGGGRDEREEGGHPGVRGRDGREEGGHPGVRGRNSPGGGRDEREEGGHPGARSAGLAPPTPGSPAAPSSTSREAFRVVDGDGRGVRAFRCEHCRVLFLDHVMFTIHMGCHGFRQPFECNICGHRSQDRYEFSSHIVRGEHILE